MSNQKIIDRARNLFLTKCSERDDQLKGDIQYTFNNLGSRNILRSSIASSDISRVLSKEFKIRSDISWQSLSRSLEIGDVEVLETLNSDLKEELKLELNQQRQRLIDLIKSKLRNMELLEHMKEIESSLSQSQNQAISTYSAEIDLYIDNLNKLAMLKRPQEAVTPEDGTMPDKRKIFVVHGRDDRLRNDFFSFLRALGLQPIEWSKALKLTEKATPYTGEAIESAFKNAQAVIVLLSPDDEVRLSPELWKEKEDENEKNIRLQARPNVLFEAGMAFGTHPDRTLLIEVGQVKAFSDVAGRHVVRLSNSPEGRNDIAERLRTAGCDVSTSGSDWLKIGDFSVKRKKANESIGYAQRDLTEGDIIALLDDWWPKSGESVPDNVKVNFSEVDRLLSLPSGSTKKHITQVASRKGFKSVSSSNVVAIFKYDVTIE